MRGLAACVVAFALVAGAAEAAQVSGFIDVGYNWNLEGQSPNRARLYSDDPDTFTVNAAHLKLSGMFAEDSEYVVELDIGYNNSLESWAALGMWSESLIQEAYIGSKLGDNGLNLRAGKFEALSGMEGMDSPENPCVSRGLLFSYALPRTYTGALLGYSDRQFDARLGLVNGWNTLVDNDTDASILARLSVEPEGSNFAFKASYLSGTEGADERDTLDVLVSFDATSRTKIDVEYTSSSEDDNEEWSGLGVQALIKPTDLFALGLRYESLDNPDGAAPGGFGPLAAGDYTSITLAPAFVLSETSTVRFEFRIDKADFNAFLDSDGNPTDAQKTLAVQVFTTF